MEPDLQRAVEQALGARVLSSRPLAGGDINDACAVRLAGGREVFVKTNRRADPRMFPREARGLTWLTQANAIRLPAVLAVSDEAGDGPHFLVLELISSAPRRNDFEARLGHGLAALHASGADTFGLGYDNFLATLEQNNSPSHSWAEFYARRRLEPQLTRAVDRGLAPSAWPRAFAALFAHLDELVGPAEPPARLHGDLWSGNLHTDADGGPCLIDPAVYGGHREIDLAMLSLFGDPGPAFTRAYTERSPLAPGASERVPLYQLYPLLAHVNLFGGSYVGSVERALRRYA